MSSQRHDTSFMMASSTCQHKGDRAAARHRYFVTQRHAYWILPPSGENGFSPFPLLSIGNTSPLRRQVPRGGRRPS